VETRTRGASRRWEAGGREEVGDGPEVKEGAGRALGYFILIRRRGVQYIKAPQLGMAMWRVQDEFGKNLPMATLAAPAHNQTRG
jgi:hypothetical protein